MSTDQWNWDHLRYFFALAEQGTLSAAGRQLNVSHTTVLRRIRVFEASLQTRLFEHTTSGYQLTSSGAELREQATVLKNSLDAVARNIARADHEIAGEVLITTTDSLGFCLMPPLVKELTEAHPELNIKVHMGIQMSDVQNREADIAIRTCKEPPDSLIGRCIGSIAFSACASLEYISENKLHAFPIDSTQHQFVMLDSGFAGIPFYDWLSSRVSADCPTIEVNNFLLAKAMCAEGMGITVLPSYMLEGDSRLQELSTLEPIEQNTLWILSHSDLRDTARMRLVRQFLFDSLSEKLVAAGKR